MAGEGTPFPERGTFGDELLARVRSMRGDDLDWRGGRAFSLVYNHGDAGLDAVLHPVAAMFVDENALNPFAFPSLLQMEQEIVAMAADLRGGPPRAGALTSGGTESIFLPVQTAREHARLERGIAEPQIITANTAHPAFAKACHYFDVERVVVPVGADLRLAPDAVAVPRFAMYAGCVMDQLSWQMNRSGLLTATARLIAQGEAIAAATAAGTPTALGLQRFGHFNGVVKRNGTALGNVVSAEITYANGLDRIETIRADGKIEGADPGMAALTGRIEVRFADSALVTQAIDGTPCELEFAYSLGANASFTFTAHAVYLPVPRIEIPGPQGIQATFDWQAARATSPARMCTAVLVSTVTGY